MRDTGGGAPGHSATNWFDHDTLSMWRMIERQETESHWRHVSALRKMAELTAAHLGRLRRYRDNLAEAWPPERSKASQAFIARLDYLIEHVRNTHDVAAANYSTVSTATAAVGAARGQVEKFRTEYLIKLQTLKDYEARVQADRTTQLPGTSIGPPPVTDADLEQVNVRARTAMSKLASTLVIAQWQLQRPTPYNSRNAIEVPSSSPPSLPGIVAVAPPPLGHSQLPRGTGQLGAIGTSTPSQAARQDHQTVGATGAWQAHPDEPVGRGPLNDATAGAHIVGPGTVTADEATTGRRAPVRLPPPADLPTQPISPGRADSPVVTNGVIGPPSAISSPAVGARAPQRVNQVGGVIGPGQNPSPVVGHPAVGQAMAERPGRPTRRRDPDNPWTVDAGVPPIVIPPDPSFTIDPGPAIGIDR
jgi:hypothetical protein